MRLFASLCFVCVALVSVEARAKMEIFMRDPIVLAEIDKATQRMHVYVDGEHTYSWKVSTGLGVRYDTPKGSHYVYRAHRMWRSRKYFNAPMPYAVFFNGGYAVHGTKALWRLGRPASHGCIRLKTEHAKLFYKLARKNGYWRTRVTVKGEFYSERSRQLRLARLKANRKARKTTWRRSARYKARKRRARSRATRWRSFRPRYVSYSRDRRRFRLPPLFN
jgi:hypothetical protein